MKQTKKVTRSQRILLQKKGIDTSNIRIVEETKYYIDYQNSDKTIQRVWKGQ